MNPDVVAAIQALRERGTLSEASAARLRRPALGELVSVHGEIRALLYLGVLLAMSGVGLFVKEYHDRLGPVALASLLGAAAAGCLLYVFRHAPPFSWAPVPTALRGVGVDYVLLLGLLLLASDLAYLESQFRWLGPQWPFHLLLVSLGYFAAAYRFDSRSVLSLALASFAAWRGVSTALAFRAVSAGGAEPAIRVNALFCGALFIAGGIASVRLNRKAHFEGVWVTLGLLLLFGGLLSGVFQPGASRWALWELPLFVCAGIVVFVASRVHRPLYFALGVLAAYLGALRALSETLHGSALAFTIAFSSLALVVFLIRAQRRLRLRHGDDA